MSDYALHWPSSSISQRTNGMAFNLQGTVDERRKWFDARAGMGGET